MFEYLPGSDLNQSMAAECVSERSVYQVGHACGTAVARLHLAGMSVVQAKGSAVLRQAGRLWSARLLAQSDKAASLLAAAGSVGDFESEAVERAKRVVEAVRSWIEDGSARFAAGCSTVVHGDLHGGNVVIHRPSSSSEPAMVFIDEQLTTGDGWFDVASLSSWAFEVLAEPRRAAYVTGLFDGYTAMLGGTAPANRVIIRYLALLSVCRLAYFARNRPQWQSPHGPGLLHRHLILLERIAKHRAAGRSNCEEPDSDLTWKEVFP
ncbi:phosphotransferase [Catenulispora sp. NL8]|uniref:Phosphotransferase n=1 Tax=Catenulispora pinistramenti TaxID=2705254 RepID=A0ABS5L2P8_9ACTN|nr:phosphotransferase [Catenulispora pinistramenti]MBS2552420.1 phosphotransferase [Catenulispora pinistramenti]